MSQNIAKAVCIRGDNLISLNPAVDGPKLGAEARIHWSPQLAPHLTQKVFTPDTLRAFEYLVARVMAQLNCRI